MAERQPDCVLCGCCLEGCPLLASTGREELSPRAKALLAGPSKAALGKLDEEAVAELAGLCLACGRCEKLCPQGVKVPELMARLRAEHPRFRQWLWRQWITRLAPFWGAAATGANLVPEALIPANFGLAMKGLKGLKPGGGLRPWLTVTSLPAEAFREKHGARPVALFHGCVGGGPRRRWADMAEGLVRGLGANLVTPGFSCCGSTLGVAGLPEDQKHARLVNVAAWRSAGEPLLATYCATCHKGLLEYSSAGADVFESSEEAARWKAAIVPLSALLAGMTVKAGHRGGAGAPALAAWHEPCHAPKSDAELVKSLLGTRLRAPAAAKCCGFGGIMQLSAPRLSEQVGADCWAGLLKATGPGQADDPSRMVVPPLALTSCSGCVMQLLATAPASAGGAGAVAGHWLETLRPG